MRKLFLLLSVVISVALICVLAQAEGAANGSLLKLASASDPLPADYVPIALSPISSAVEGVNLVTTRTSLLQEEALEPLYRMMRAAASAGETLYVRQAYRSYADEARRYELLSGTGQAAQKPGESSYQTGLSVTLVGADWKTGELTADFADSSEARWLREHAAEYGFVLRYPEGKENVTGWSYEPWHYRYVGLAAAAAMAEQGLCLEELAMNSGLIADLPEGEEEEPWAEEEIPSQPVSEPDHSVPAVRDLSTIDPEDIGPDGDYEISLGDL